MDSEIQISLQEVYLVNILGISTYGRVKKIGLVRERSSTVMQSQETYQSIL